jgi:ferritin-like protein
MAEAWHAPYDKLSRRTITLHQCIRSLMEELEAVDWYRQRADDCEDESLKAILLHNMREEIEHACMELEWLRRNNADFAGQMATYLYSEGEIAEVEERAEAGGGRSDPDKA